MTESVNKLLPLTEEWQTGMAIVAHPDDLEYGASSAIARWTGQGKNFTYCLLTSGEAGIDGMNPDDARKVRQDEQRASAAAVGVDTVEFLDFPDGVIEYGLPLRRAVARAIRRRRPHIVVTNNLRDTFDAEQLGLDEPPLNHADHIAAGRAILDGVRDAANRWVFTELLEEGLQPWGGVRQVWVANSPLSGHGVDVTDSLPQGVASLRAHEAYIKGLGRENFDPEEYLESLARRSGTHLGCKFAVCFEVFRFGTGD
ncbi:PIG-L deacetylase family protein [Streptomyces sp. NPDC001118]|uniref:PIG-L deacetylase family protein n=1 Tax=unclassified Streptomyces TaxID=2593676 RepID=UPI003326A94C